jgi:methyl-accepting chemotaxis protein
VRLGALNEATSLIVNDRYPTVALANSVLDGINSTAVRMRNLLIMEDPEQIKLVHAQIVVARQEVTDNIARLDKLLDTEQGRQIFAGVVDAPNTLSGRSDSCNWRQRSRRSEPPAAFDRGH